MEQEEMLLIVRGQDKIDAAKKMVRECKTGYFIVYDRESNCVYYRTRTRKQEHRPTIPRNISILLTATFRRSILTT